MELIFIPLLGIGILLALLVRGQRKQMRAERIRRGEERERTKFTRLHISQCPSCAEDIKIEAKICKHCGNDVELHNLSQKEENARLQDEFDQQQERTKVGRLRVQVTFLVVLGISFLLLGVLGFFWPFILFGIGIIGVSLFAYWWDRTRSSGSISGFGS